MSAALDADFFRATNDILVPTVPVAHRADEYDPAVFDLLRQMQGRHFWYRGRHRFLLHAVRQVRHCLRREGRRSLGALDLGGGCGGWIDYLHRREPAAFAELALADSSIKALEYAAQVVGPNVKRYQVDLMQLPWKERWDVVFLLDVLEHIPDDVAVLKQIHQVLRPGGWLFVTTPAFPSLWSYNDDLVHHVRRYVHRDFVPLAEASGMELSWSRYFLFFLSPLLILSRLRPPRRKTMTEKDIQEHLAKTHRVPSWPINGLLGLIFGLETPLGSWLPFPWGTSILGVFRKPG
jgi:2-polyprenyl-3-methyl-5-hydroxy-6-metoxy-1,4-benzoquinol methylase